jgi:hypothetical protein
VDATQGAVVNALRKRAAEVVARAESFRQNLVDNHAKTLAEADDLVRVAREELKRIDAELAKP